MTYKLDLQNKFQRKIRIKRGFRFHMVPDLSPKEIIVRTQAKREKKHTGNSVQSHPHKSTYLCTDLKW